MNLNVQVSPTMKLIHKIDPMPWFFELGLENEKWFKHEKESGNGFKYYK